MNEAVRNPQMVSVAVCTFRRAHLAQTLQSLAAIDAPDGFRIEIVVADNDETPSAKDLVRRCEARMPFALRYVHAPARNISLARNACLDAARGRYLAFVDDDELVSPGWLKALLGELGVDGAAVVLGPVDAVYAPSAPRWMREGDLHSTRPVVVSGRILTGYTCNVLLDRGSPELEGIRFDEKRGRSGGEDTAFFTQFTARGGRIGYAPLAVILEPVPENRATVEWLRARRFRMGQTHGELLGEGRSTLARLRHSAVAGAKLFACAGLATRHGLNRARAERELLRAVLHAGTVSGLLGMRVRALYGMTPPSSERDAHAA